MEWSDWEGGAHPWLESGPRNAVVGGLLGGKGLLSG